MRIGEAVSYGAVTIVNAMATGKGAALGVDLWTKARVTLTRDAGQIICRNLTETNEDQLLMKTTVNLVLRRLKVHRMYGAIVETKSNIPVAVGLKSSSAASNSVTLATLQAVGKKSSGLQAVRLGVEASLQAGVTITGAFDDACASFLGGVVITNNTRRQLLHRFKPPENLRALIYVPEAKKYTKDVDVRGLSKIKPVIDLAFLEAMRGNYWVALTLNGLTYAESFEYDTTPIKDAISSGAVASGLTGKGPAVVAIVEESRLKAVLNAWRFLHGKVIRASFNQHRAESTSVNGWKS